MVRLLCVSRCSFTYYDARLSDNYCRNIRPSLDQSCAILNLDTVSTVMLVLLAYLKVPKSGHTDCCFLRYAPMDLISASLALLGQSVNNSQALENPAILSRLRSLLKGIRVRQVKAGKTGRIRSIKELRGAAGNYTFVLSDGTETTIAVRFSFQSMTLKDD